MSEQFSDALDFQVYIEDVSHLNLWAYRQLRKVCVWYEACCN
jgi:hypothetical protein